LTWADLWGQGGHPRPHKTLEVIFCPVKPRAANDAILNPVSSVGLLPLISSRKTYKTNYQAQHGYS